MAAKKRSITASLLLPATVIELSCASQSLIERRLAVSLKFLNPLLNLVVDIHHRYICSQQRFCYILAVLSDSSAHRKIFRYIYTGFC